jgi:methylmalonyl-CoA/ethylmalonyl-CoA epimerase
MKTGLLGRLHHVGIVVASIEAALPGFLSSLDAQATTGVIHDPLQRAKVLFLQTHPSDAALIELVEPVGDQSPVRRFLEKGGGMNHLCYEVERLSTTLQELKARKAVIVSKPKPAVAFNGREVAWAMTQAGLLIELLESPSS